MSSWPSIACADDMYTNRLTFLLQSPMQCQLTQRLRLRDADMRCAPMFAGALKETDDAICVRPEDVWPAGTSGEYTPEETAERLGRTRRVRAIELSYAGLPSRTDDS